MIEIQYQHTMTKNKSAEHTLQTETLHHRLYFKQRRNLELLKSVQVNLYNIDQNRSATMQTVAFAISIRYKSVTGPKTTVELFAELTLVRRARTFVSCSGSLGNDSGPFVSCSPLNFERSCVTRRSSLQHDFSLD